MREVEQVVRRLLPAADGDPAAVVAAAHPAAMAGAAKGLESLIRLNQKVQPPDSVTLNRLRATATLVSDPADADFALLRRLAWTAVNAAAAADAFLLQRGAADPDPQVRRLAAGALGNLPLPEADRRALLATLLRDASATVRYEAVRVYGRTLQARDCAPVLAAVDDVAVHVALAAIDVLGHRLSGPAAHRPAAGAGRGAVGGLRRLAPAGARAGGAGQGQPRRGDGASRGLRRACAWPVRLYAARAAAQLQAAARLERLAADANDNVRYEALVGLPRCKRPRRRRRSSSTRSAGADYQLVLAAAAALEGTALRSAAASRPACAPSRGSPRNGARPLATRAWRCWRVCAKLGDPRPCRPAAAVPLPTTTRQSPSSAPRRCEAGPACCRRRRAAG